MSDIDLGIKNVGRFDFKGKWTGDAAADFYLGLLDQTRRRAIPINSIAIANTVAFFFQDDW